MLIVWNFQVPSSIDVDKPMTALIPFWDLANHDNGEISTDFDPETESTSCMAHKDFKSGDQFTIFYGIRTNVDLVSKYKKNTSCKLVL